MHTDSKSKGVSASVNVFVSHLCRLLMNFLR